MKRYSLFHPLIMAFYSKALYRDVARQWRGIGIFYILLLAIISLLVFMALQTRPTMLSEFIDGWVKQVPTLTIKQGMVSIDKPVPYFIYDPDKGTAAMIIDTSGNIVSLQNTPAMVLLTQDKMLIKDASGKIETHDLSTVQHFSLTADKLKRFMFEIIFLLYFIGSFLISVFGLFICASLVKLFTSAPLSYAALCRLTAVAFTPTTWLSAILNFLNVHVPFYWIISLIIIIGYILYAVDANKPSALPPDADNSPVSSSDVEKRM